MSIPSFEEQFHLSFFEEDVRPFPRKKALFHVIPAPLEKSVSYGKGAALGPQAIIAASQQLEVFDGYSKPASEVGIYTARPLDCEFAIQRVIKNIEEAVHTAFQLKIHCCG